MPRVWLLLIILLLAGCTSEGSDEPVPDEASTTLGSISGSTVTPQIMPIPDAIVRIPQAQIETESNLFGGFRFNAMPPGTYRIEAEAEGYEPANVTVTVVAGETTKVRVVLKQDLPPVPGSGHDKFEGRFPAGFGPADPHSGPIREVAGIEDCTCVFEIDAHEAMRTLVLDVVWDDPYEASPMELRWNVTSDAGGNATGKGTSPLNAHIQDAAVPFGNASRITVTILPDEVRPTQELGFTLVATYWTVDPAPEGWRFEGE